MGGSGGMEFERNATDNRDKNIKAAAKLRNMDANLKSDQLVISTEPAMGSVIAHDGDIILNCNLPSHISLRSGGNIEITGSIGNGLIVEAKGNLTLHTVKNAKLAVGGEAIMYYLEDSSLKCDGNVKILESVKQSNVIARGEFHCKLIDTSLIVAKKDIWVEEISAGSHVATEQYITATMAKYGAFLFAQHGIALVKASKVFAATYDKGNGYREILQKIATREKTLLNEHVGGYVTPAEKEKTISVEQQQSMRDEMINKNLKEATGTSRVTYHSPRYQTTHAVRQWQFRATASPLAMTVGAVGNIILTANGTSKRAALLSYMAKNALDKNLSGYDLSGMNLQNIDFSGWDLSGCDLRGCNLSMAKLDFANLSHVNMSPLSRGIFRSLLGTNLKGASLNGTSFSHAILNAVEFSGCQGDKTRFEHASLQGAIFAGAETLLTHPDFENAALGQTILAGCQITQAWTRNTELPDLEKNTRLGGRFEIAQHKPGIAQPPLGLTISRLADAALDNPLAMLASTANSLKIMGLDKGLSKPLPRWILQTSGFVGGIAGLQQIIWGKNPETRGMGAFHIGIATIALAMEYQLLQAVDVSKLGESDLVKRMAAIQTVVTQNAEISSWMEKLSAFGIAMPAPALVEPVASEATASPAPTVG